MSIRRRLISLAPIRTTWLANTIFFKIAWPRRRHTAGGRCCFGRENSPLGDIHFDFTQAEAGFARTAGQKIIDVTLFPVFDEHGAVANFVGLNVDVTAQRRQELLQSVLYRIADVAHADLRLGQLYGAIHAILGDVLDVKNFFIALLDTSRGVVVPAYFVDEMDQTPPERPLSNGFTEFVIRHDAPQLLRKEELALLQARNEVDFGGTLPEVWLGVPLQTTAGTIGVIAVQNYADPAAYGREEMRVLQFVSEQIATVIERKQAEEELRELAAALAEQTRMTDAILATTPDLFTVQGVDGRYQYISPPAKAFLGIPAHVRSRGKSWQELNIPPQIGTAVARDLQALPATGGPIRREVQLPRDDALLDVEYVLTPMRDPDGTINAVVSTIRDITARKKEQEELYHRQKVESLGVLAGGLAHDFNNLLVAMIGQTTLALNKIALDDPARMHIDKAVDAAQKAAALTQQMLAYSGRGRFYIQEIDLNQIIEENAHLLKASIPKSVDLLLELAPDLPPIAVDVSQIQQIVMNLVINGAEALAGRPGTVRVQTRLRRLTDVDSHYWERTHLPISAGDYVALVVTDTGAGMDAETLDRIFDPFFTTKFTGRGLGLAAVLGIVRGHKGGLQVQSAPGQGTGFEVLFPLDSPHERAEENEMEAETAVPHPVDSAQKVLVIDDEEAVRIAAQDILALEGITAFTAVDGPDGIELFKAHHEEIGLIILDLSMPGMRGDETLQRLREIDPGARVLLSSGYNASEAQRGIPAESLAGYLQKPYKVDHLIAEVKRHLSDSAPN
jgi:PAS domain S-box-containing protein